MKKSIDIVNQLQKYFGVKVIGSQLLVDAGLLHEDDSGDIDIAAVISKDVTARIHSFLTDIGFVPENISQKDTPYSQESTIRTVFRNNEYDKPIDLNYFRTEPDVYTIPELIKEKFQRSKTSDLKQIAMAVFKKGGSSLRSIKELQEFYLNNQPDEEETTG